MPRRWVALFVSLVVLVAAAMLARGLPRPPAPTPPRPDAPVPSFLLPHAEFTGAAVHPRRPWLVTSSMTPAGEGEGQIVVWDLATVLPVHVNFDEHGFGFEAHPGLLRWAPIGDRLAVSAGTNAIMVFEDGQELTFAYPDDTRDSQVFFCWLGTPEQLYASASDEGTGNAAILTVGAPDGAPRWTPPGIPPEHHRQMRYNAAIGAVVGDGWNALTAVDVTTGTMRYDEPLAGVLPPNTNRSVAWSDDGRRVAMAPMGKNVVVAVFDGDTGRVLAKVPVSGEVDAVHWSPAADRLLIVSGPAFDDPRQILVLDAGGRTIASFEAPLAREPRFDARAVDWSPDGRSLALLLRDGTIRLVDAARGTPSGGFATDPPLVKRPRGDFPGLLWAGDDRIVGLARDRLTFWTTSGRRLAHYTVSPPPNVP